MQKQLENAYILGELGISYDMIKKFETFRKQGIKPRDLSSRLAYPYQDFLDLCLLIKEEKEDRKKYDRVGNTNLKIERVIFSDPATIVVWSDNTKTIVKTQNDEPFDTEKGLALAIIKRLYGNSGSYYDLFKKYCADQYEVLDKMKKTEEELKKSEVKTETKTVKKEEETKV